MTDVHGNLPALKVALSEMANEGCNEIIIGGDTIGIGPFPAECLELIRKTPNTRLINGNHELMAIYDLTDEFLSSLHDDEDKHTLWYKAELSQDHMDFLKDRPLIIDVQYEGVSVKFMHYAFETNRPELEPFDIPVGGDLEKKDLFSKYQADLICFGHDHLAADIPGNPALINPGSLGCFPKPIARFIIITFEDRKYRIDKYALEYDDSSLLPAFVGRDVPARQFIVKAFFGGRLK